MFLSGVANNPGDEDTAHSPADEQLRYICVFYVECVLYICALICVLYVERVLDMWFPYVECVLHICVLCTPYIIDRRGRSV